jgi:DNA topoisomerase IB
VCRKYYVHPSLLSAYLMGDTVPLPPPVKRRARRSQPGAALRRDEIAVLEFLQDRV